MPVPVCRTVQEAYDAGRADALAAPAAGPELAAMVADLIMPWLKEIAAQRNKLLTVAEAAKQLGMFPHTAYVLMYKGELVSGQIASRNERRFIRRIEQAEVDAFIARYPVKGGTTPGGVL